MLPHIVHSIDLGLYIHIPWCVRKCPYCDFNSHQKKTSEIPEMAYLQALIEDLKQESEKVRARRISSIFIGGGTPSLMSGQFMEQLLQAAYKYLNINQDIEITLEANPGTVEFKKFKDFKHAGVNRLSIGVQSFNNEYLKKLGRIHNGDEALKAIDAAHQAGFKQINCDLMYNLPGQSLGDAMTDIEQAISAGPTHISWYQLTIEPNTEFYRNPPTVPEDEEAIVIENEGLLKLKNANYERYEISAFAKDANFAKHNLNYWRFGDYLGIGAGAHGKLTDINTLEITRSCKYKTPHKYLNKDLPFTSNSWNLTDQDKRYEFMLNALRLINGFDIKLFTERAGLSRIHITERITKAKQKGLLDFDSKRMWPTELGIRFLNDLINLF